MDNKIYSLSTSELENRIKINIDGILFEVKNIKSKDYYENINVDDINVVDKEIENILGKDSINKINEARINSGKEEMDIGIKLNLLLKLIGIYQVGISNNLGKTANEVISQTYDAVQNVTNKFTNREQRRNYNKSNYKRNNYNRRYY